MAPADPPGRETQLLALLREALARAEAGEPVDVAELCRDAPELAGTVAQALGQRAALSRLALAARDVDPLVGTLLAGRYRLRERLGQGAMGVVYRADDEDLKRAVAVKLFAPVAAGETQGEQRFQREAELLARLRHPHVVTVFDRGRSEQGLLFLVTELLEGAPLADLVDAVGGVPAPLLDDWPSPPETSPLRMVARWGAELAAGLGAAHAAGVFHRDVKPSNVFVRRDHRAVLLDFGIAAGEGDAAFTATATTLGTPFYMAPEQAAGTVRRSAQVDVYGLCATLYHLLAGRPPYQGDARAVLARIAREDPEPLARLRPDLPRDLRAIVERGLERDPRRRYADMAALERDLRAFLEYRPVTARPVGRFGRLVRRIRRAPARSAAVGLGVLAVVLLGVAVPLYREWRAQENARALNDLDARLPPLLALEGTPAQRKRITAEEQARHLALLDEMLALDERRVLPRVLRSAIHEDLGDAVSAAADLQQLAQWHADPCLRALAERARHVGEGTATRPTSAPQHLPPPVTLAGRCAYAVATLRMRQPGYAVQALEALEPVRDDLVARDVRVFVLLGHGDSGGGIAAFQAALEEVERLRAACGYDTARWLAAQGTALLVLERQKDALPLLELANEMVPGRHGTLLNLGVAYRRTNRLEEAERVLVEARRVRPWMANVIVNLALVTADKGDLDGAMALANELPETGDEAWRQPDLLGHLHYRRAVLQWEEHREAAQAAAAEAYRYLRQAGQLPGAPRKRIAAVTALARMLRDGDETRGFVHLLQVQADDPLNPFQLDAIATLLPADHLDGDAILALRSFLRSLVIALAPGNAALRQQQERMREFEQRQGKKR